jgi:hypothetical protein
MPATIARSVREGFRHAQIVEGVTMSTDPAKVADIEYRAQYLDTGFDPTNPPTGPTQNLETPSARWQRYRPASLVRATRGAPRRFYGAEACRTVCETPDLQLVWRATLQRNPCPV